MIKKYLPFFALLLAATLLFYVKSHQRGSHAMIPQQEQVNLNSNDAQISGSENEVDRLRSASHIIYSKHARCRMDCRHIDENEIKEILKNGQVNTRKIEEDSRGKTYPLEGVSEGHHLRVVFAPKGDNAVEVVTCIDLDTEWQCDCE
jgi:hypothetical protein